MNLSDSYFEKLDNIGEVGTPMEPDILLMRSAIVDLIELLTKLEERVKRIEQREPA